MKKIFTILFILAVCFAQAQIIFPGGSGLSEGTNQTIWVRYPICNSGGARNISFSIDRHALTDSTADTYQILGANQGTTFYDQVIVADEAGSSAAKLVTLGYIRPNFPYKWIGFKFIKGGGTVTGTYTIYYTESSYSVLIN